MDEAYNEGYEDCEHGFGRDRNPFDEDTEEYWEWLEGWEDALADMNEE